MYFPTLKSERCFKTRISNKALFIILYDEKKIYRSWADCGEFLFWGITAVRHHVVSASLILAELVSSINTITALTVVISQFSTI